VAARKLPSTAKAVVDAATKADIGALKALLSRGADVNGSYRGYRALHALIQTKPHADATEPSAKQLKTFSWLLAHGADPELPGAWTPSRAILVAAFMGASPYVDLLIRHGCATDVYVAAALGDAAAVKRALGRDKTLATSRDPHGLTVLQCAAASRMGRHDKRVSSRLLTIAAMALDAGADIRRKDAKGARPVDVARAKAVLQWLTP
jgi:hypothetical protein